MLRYLKLISFSSLTLSGDILFSLALIWRVLALDGSAKMLGLFLCLVTLVTFVLQKMSVRLKNLLEKSPQFSFALTRLTGIIGSIVFIPMLWYENMPALYAAGVVFTIINFLSTLTIEAVIAQKVLSHEISSNKASRMLQVIILSSSFLGASLLGFILSLGNMKSILLFNIITYTLGAIFFMIASRKERIRQPIPIIKTAQPHLHKTTQYGLLWLAFLGLFFLLIQISAFNFLVPLIAQHQKHWTATQFGFIDAAAEFGGVFATILMAEKGGFSKLWTISFLVILLVDTLFYLTNSVFFMCGAVLFLGLFASAFRMKQREIIFDSVSNINEVYDWTGRITAMTTFLKAFAPIMLAFVAINPAFDLMLIGIIVGLGILVVQFGFYIYHRRQLKITKSLTYATSV